MQITWTDREDSKSLTSETESVLLAAVMGAKEQINVATIGVPSAFLQVIFDTSLQQERIVMKGQGQLVDILAAVYPQLYGKSVIFENGMKIYMSKSQKQFMEC